MMSATGIRIIGLHSSWWDRQIKTGEIKLMSVYSSRKTLAS